MRARSMYTRACTRLASSIVCGFALRVFVFFSPDAHTTYDYKGWTRCLRMHTLEDLLALFSHNVAAGVMTA